MENVVILSQAEYQALQDEIYNLKTAVNNSNTYYFINNKPISANEYIDYLQKQNAELTEDESHKDTLYCEQRDLVERLRDDLSNQSNYIDELAEDIATKQKVIENLTDVLDSIRYEANHALIYSVK
jgi:uncharacterized coiled-coil DUF342 family protein